MNFNRKKNLFLVCILTAGSLLGMEQTPPPAKVQKLGESSCVSDGKPVEPSTPPRPIAAMQCPAQTPDFLAGKYAQRKIRRRPKPLLFADDSQTAQAEETATPPPAKSQKIDDSKVPYNPINFVFANPYLLANIAQHLSAPDLCNFARICTACKEGTKVLGAKERVVANEVVKRENTPIRYVLKKANGNNTVKIFGITCNTQLLLQYLHETASLLDEPFLAKEIIYERARINIPPAIAECLSPDEIMTSKPAIYVPIPNNQMTEDDLIQRVAKAAHDFPDNPIALDLSPSIISEQFYNNDINEPLINKLAQFHIVSLHCEGQEFPQGLGCLAALGKLRELSITNCNIAEDVDQPGHVSIPDELCDGLPLLTVLKVQKSKVTDVSFLIGEMKHLTSLDLSGNNIQEFPPTLGDLHLQILDLRQVVPIEAKKLSKSLHSLRNLRSLALSCSGRTNPIDSSCDLTQLSYLHLDSDIGLLQQNYQQLRNLKVLLAAKFPGQCISKLPLLERLHVLLNHPTVINFEAMQYIAFKDCQFVPLPANNAALKRIFELWQLIQANRALIQATLNSLTQDQVPNQQFVDIINHLMKKTLTGYKLYDLIKAPLRCDHCYNFITKTLLADHPLIKGTQEAGMVSDRFRPNDDNFKYILKTIALMIGQNIPLYSFEQHGSIACNQFLIDQLTSMVTAITQILKVIEDGDVITDKQINNCLNQLQICIHNHDHYETSKSLIANLLFHHAIVHNNFTNAAIMLNNYSANIKAVLIPSGDGPLHIAIRNRMNTINNETTKQQAESVIYFLIKNGASLDLKNRENKTPKDLIPHDDPLLDQINRWRIR